ncbi:DUF3391 domain-containing protein, partial [Acinetobacter baumannii]
LDIDEPPSGGFLFCLGQSAESADLPRRREGNRRVDRDTSGRARLPMLKKIPTSEVKLGMYLQALEGSWLSHPFWKTKF